MRILATLAAATAAVAALVTPAHADGPLGEKGGTLALPLRDAVKVEPAAEEQRAGYQRTAFRHWTDADKDGCSTRAEVLKAEAFIRPAQAAGCTLSGGEWYSPTTTCTSTRRASWTLTTWSRSQRPGTPALPPGRLPSGGLRQRPWRRPVADRGHRPQ